MKDYPKDFLDLLNFVTAKRPRTVVPLVTYRVSGKDGRSIAAYKFGDPAEANTTCCSVLLQTEPNLGRVSTVKIGRTRIEIFAQNVFGRTPKIMNTLQGSMSE